MTIANIVVGSPFGEWRNDRVEGEPRQLDEFYAPLLGMRIVRDDWIKIATEPSVRPQLAFGDGWSELGDVPGVVGRVVFDCLDPAAVAPVYAGLLDVYADPAGHPFCLCAPGQ